jgi:Ribbon-helix-helix domain
MAAVFGRLENHDTWKPTHYPASRSIDICMPVWYYGGMKRTALFLEEEQIKKLQKLSDKTGAPLAELIRRAIDKYLQERARELK